MSAQPINGTSATGRYQAKCRICGKVVAEFPVLEIPVIGHPNEKAQKVLTILGTHIATRHHEQFVAGGQLVADFQAFLVMSQFETQDPTIGARAETIRAGLQALTRKYMLSDQHIEQAIVALDSQNQLNTETVGALIRQLRDVLTEQGQYAPKLETPQSTLVV